MKHWTSAWLGRHLAHLRHSLEELAERVRTAVAEAVSRVVAGAVHEAVRLLTAPAHSPPERWPARYRGDRDERDWDDPYRREWDDEPSDWGHDAADEDPAPELPTAPRWSRAVVTALHAAAAWVRRQTSHRPLLRPLGHGLAAVLDAGAVGASFMAGTGVVGAALAVMKLINGLEAGARSLAS